MPFPIVHRSGNITSFGACVPTVCEHRHWRTLNANDNRKHNNMTTIAGYREERQRWETVACRKYNELCVCVSHKVPADRTLPLRLQGSEHDNDRVVPGWGLDKATELVPIHPDDRTPRRPLHHLFNLLWQQVLNTQTGKRAEETMHLIRTFRFTELRNPCQSNKARQKI